MSDGGIVLEACDVNLGYGGGPVVRELSLTLRAGEVTVLLGPNGAGKTSTLLGLAGELEPISGTIAWCGSLRPRRLWGRARDGLAYIPDEHAVTRSLSVQDNIRVAMRDVRPAFELFPELTAHRRRLAGLLSGGQQKMLSLSMALAKTPKALLADELSLGLAPMIVTRLLDEVRAAADRGVAVLLVEQHARQALKIADHAIMLSRGRVVASDAASVVMADLKSLNSAYLGATTSATVPEPESGLQVEPPPHHTQEDNS